MKILVIIPMSKDTGTILEIISDIKQHAPSVDYLVINGTDEYWVEARLINNKIPHIKTGYRTRHGDAFSIGVQHAIDNDYDAVIEYDSKGHFDARDIPYFISTYNNSDAWFVIGSRYSLPKSKQTSRAKTLGRVIKMTTGHKVDDAGLRFRLIGKNLFKEFNADSWWRIGPDIVSYLVRNKIPYKEIQVNTKHSVVTEYDNWLDSVSNTWVDILSMVFVQRFRKYGKKVKNE